MVWAVLIALAGLFLRFVIATPDKPLLGFLGVTLMLFGGVLIVRTLRELGRDAFEREDERR